LPKMKIEAKDVPLDALSDLESNPEDVDEKDVAIFLKKGGIENAPSKWMSRKKIWTTTEVSLSLLTVIEAVTYIFFMYYLSSSRA